MRKCKKIRPELIKKLAEEMEKECKGWENEPANPEFIERMMKLVKEKEEADCKRKRVEEQARFSANIITRIKRNNYISLDGIEKICKALHFGVDDIFEFIQDNANDYDLQIQGGGTKQ